MSIDRFFADAAGWSEANNVAPVGGELTNPKTKHIWHTPGNPGRLVVFTGADMPIETAIIGDLSVSRFQLIRALAMAGKTNATVTAIAGMSVARQTLWAEANDFRRADAIINALKNRLPGVNNQEMDDIFIAASALDPATV